MKANPHMNEFNERVSIIGDKQTKSFPVLYKNKENCCGCSACYAICPMNAITMDPDEEGFLYPTVNTEKCIRCYKCISVCTFKTDQKKKGYYKTEKVGDT